MATEAKSGGLTGYIEHHLTHGTRVVGEGGFWTVHWDSLLVGAVVGGLVLLYFWSKARKATAGVPSKARPRGESPAGKVPSVEPSSPLSNVTCPYQSSKAS